MVDHQKVHRQPKQVEDQSAAERDGGSSKSPVNIPVLPRKSIERQKSGNKLKIRVDSPISVVPGNFFNAATERYPMLAKSTRAVTSGMKWLAKRTLISKNSKWKFKWDLYVGILIFYSVMIVPLRIGFPQAEEKMGPKSDTCWMDSVVDVCFVLDMVFCFNQAVELSIEGEEIVVSDR